MVFDSFVWKLGFRLERSPPPAPDETASSWQNDIAFVRPALESQRHARTGWLFVIFRHREPVAAIDRRGGCEDIGCRANPSRLQTRGPMLHERIVADDADRNWPDRSTSTR